MPIDEITQPRKAGTRKVVIGLRKVLTDPRSTPRQRLRACELLIEYEAKSGGDVPDKKHPLAVAKANKLRALLETDDKQGSLAQTLQ